MNNQQIKANSLFDMIESSSSTLEEKQAIHDMAMITVPGYPSLMFFKPGQSFNFKYSLLQNSLEKPVPPSGG